MSTLSLDDNYRVTMLRSGDPIGSFYTPADAEKSTTDWHRLMPDGNTAALVSGNDRQLNIGTLRDDILSVDDWELMILNAGYFQQIRILSEDSGVLTLHDPIKHLVGLQTLGDNSIEYVMFPRLTFPLGIVLHASAVADELEIGVAKENVYAPTDVKKLAQNSDDQQWRMHSRQIQKLFYKFTSLTTNATHSISWGEHYKRK